MRKQLKSIITSQEQMSESFILHLLLAFSGGFQDAYTYIVRDKVFANAQTGNIVLMSTYLMEGSIKRGLLYLFPLFSFMAGIFISDVVQHSFKNAHKLHWRQGILLLEISIMLISGFIPNNLNMLCNCLISFSCALQIHSFKKLHGNVYASTMCIGNLKSGVISVSSYLRSKNQKDIQKARDYFSVITVFGIGAGLGGNLSKLFDIRTIWVSFAVLVICFLVMELDRNK